MDGEKRGGEILRVWWMNRWGLVDMYVVEIELYCVGNAAQRWDC